MYRPSLVHHSNICDYGKLGPYYCMQYAFIIGRQPPRPKETPSNKVGIFLGFFHQVQTRLRCKQRWALSSVANKRCPLCRTDVINLLNIFYKSTVAYQLLPANRNSDVTNIFQMAKQHTVPCAQASKFKQFCTDWIITNILCHINVFYIFKF